MIHRQPTAIDTSVDAWRAQHPSDITKVMMLSYLVGLLAAMERDNTLPVLAVREVVKAFEKHTVTKVAI